MSVYPASQSAAVRVKVRKCEPNVSPDEWRKFSIDPEITSLEVLYSLLAKAFDIKSDFAIKYKAFDPAGNEIYLAVLSDWDLDAAFLRINNLAIQTTTEPCLILQIDVKPFTEVKDWDASDVSPSSSSSRSRGGSGPAGASAIVGGGSSSSTALSPVGYAASMGGARDIISPLQQSLGASQKYVQHMQTKLPGLIMNQMEKTFSLVQKAFNLSEETMATLPPRTPLADHEFRLFLDALGQIQRSDELRKVIFFGGIDPSLRRVVWKHILNVYPGGMNGHQRMEYMKCKSEQYFRLREVWKTAIKQGCVAGELSYVTSMVKKDVLRTDRLHPFYAGSDDNQNIAALFNILTTYALNHPSVSYCQGMSDLASPLLVCMQDEAQAYICFCAIMARVRGNFLLDGIAMTQKFAHLTEALSFYDPDFWEYLKAQQADDLLFCYRWLLLELKREFPFEDALRMLEVQWSSLRYGDCGADRELPLFEREFTAVVPAMEMPPLSSSSMASPNSSSLTSNGSSMAPISPSYFVAKPSQQRESAYTKVCALRRQSSSASLSSLSSSLSAMHGGEAMAAAAAARDAARERARGSRELIEDDTDDDVFPSSAPSSASNNNSRGNSKTATPSAEAGGGGGAHLHFNFHPTNPFKEDAQSPKRQSALAAAAATTNTPTGSAALAKQMGEGMRRVGTSSRGHFKELKEKLAATSRKGLSFDEIAAGNEKSQQKLVKNFNEFLNFATINKNRLADKLSANAPATSPPPTGNRPTATTTTTRPGTLTTDEFPALTKTITPSTTNAPPQLHPLLHLARGGGCTSSLDDSDSSSVPETTWSCSTAATAIQQLNNLSSSLSNLQLELSSMTSSVVQTPSDLGAATTPGRVEAVNAAAIDGDTLSLTPDEANEQDQEYYPMTTAMTRELRLEAENLDRQVFGERRCLTQQRRQQQQMSASSSSASTTTTTTAGTGGPAAPSPLANKAASAAAAAMRIAASDIEYEQLDKDSLDLLEDLQENEIIACPDLSELMQRRRARDAKARSSIEPLQHVSGQGLSAAEAAQLEALRLNPFLDEALLLDVSASDAEFMAAGMRDVTHHHLPMLPTSSSLPEVLVPLSATDSAAMRAALDDDSTPIEVATNASEELTYAKVVTTPRRQALSSAPECNGLREHTGSAAAAGVGSAAGVARDAACASDLSTSFLPPPTVFGGGNPFLMFLCLTLLLQHRNTIMKSAMDYNEIAMHFDKMVRKHDVTRVLNQARRMYIDYLKVQRLQAPAKGEAANVSAAASVGGQAGGGDGPLRPAGGGAAQQAAAYQAASAAGTANTTTKT